jgi:hypothetical protein
MCLVTCLLAPWLHRALAGESAARGDLGGGARGTAAGGAAPAPEATAGSAAGVPWSCLRAFQCCAWGLGRLGPRLGAAGVITGAVLVRGARVLHLNGATPSLVPRPVLAAFPAACRSLILLHLCHLSPSGPSPFTNSASSAKPPSPSHPVCPLRNASRGWRPSAGPSTTQQRAASRSV